MDEPIKLDDFITGETSIVLLKQDFPIFLEETIIPLLFPKQYIPEPFKSNLCFEDDVPQSFRDFFEAEEKKSYQQWQQQQSEMKFYYKDLNSFQRESDGKIFIYEQEPFYIYLLGNSIEEATEALRKVEKEGGWWRILRRVDSDTGEILNDCDGIAIGTIQIHEIIKNRSREAIIESVCRSIQNHSDIPEYRKEYGCKMVREEILNADIRDCTESMDVIVFEGCLVYLKLYDTNGSREIWTKD